MVNFILKKKRVEKEIKKRKKAQEDYYEKPTRKNKIKKEVAEQDVKNLIEFINGEE